MYAASGANGQMASQAIGTTGGTEAHENRQPLLAINFCISLLGTYPPRQ
jgi:microcystin-dependent protein